MNVSKTQPLSKVLSYNRGAAKSNESMQRLINKFKNAFTSDKSNVELKEHLRIIVELITILQFEDNLASDLQFNRNSTQELANFLNNLFFAGDMSSDIGRLTSDFDLMFNAEDIEQLFDICDHTRKWWPGNANHLTGSATRFLNDLNIETSKSKDEQKYFKSILSKNVDRRINFDLLYFLTS